MSKLIFILITGAFLLDMFMSYNYIKTYKNLYPKNDWTLAEANPILRFCLKSYGLEKGMVIGSIILFSFISILIVLLNENFRYLLLGMFIMGNIFHFVNWQAMKRLKLIKNKK